MKPENKKLIEAKRQTQKAFAENFVKSIESRVTFLKTKTLNRILCSFDNDAICQNARTAIEIKPETGLTVYDAHINKNQSFYVAFTKVNVESASSPKQAIIPESSKDSQDSKTAEVSFDPASPIDTKIDKETLNQKIISEMRKVGIGIKLNPSNQVEFYNEQHQLMFEKVVGVFQIGKKISQESVRAIQELLGEFDDTSKLIDDFDFADWLMKAEEVRMGSKFDIVEKGLRGETIKPRTAPFIFKNEQDAKEWFNILSSIGLNPEWQPKEPRNFWLAQRTPRRKKHNRTKRHPVSNALEDLGIMGHPNDTDYYYQNSPKRNSYCVLMHKTASEIDRIKFTEKTVKKLQELMPKWEFFLSKKGMGFCYRDPESPFVNEPCEEINDQDSQSKDEGDAFIKMFSEEQWQHLLLNTPREILIKVFPDEFGTKPEIANVEKQKLQKISENFLLIGKDHPMISGIMAMDSKSLKKVEDI